MVAGGRVTREHARTARRSPWAFYSERSGDRHAIQMRPTGPVERVVGTAQKRLQTVRVNERGVFDEGDRDAVRPCGQWNPNVETRVDRVGRPRRRLECRLQILLATDGREAD